MTLHKFTIADIERINVYCSPDFILDSKCTKAEFKEFERRLKFKPRLKYGWFHLNLYSMFQDLSRRSIETGFWVI